MINSLFDKGTMKKFDALAKKQAKLEDKKKNLVKKSMETMNSETLVDVLEIVCLVTYTFSANSSCDR